MSNISITVSIPHLQREFDVSLPETITGKRLYDAMLSKVPELKEADLGGGGPVVYELFSKKVAKKIYPDHRDQTLVDLNIKSGDTIYLKKDMDPGGVIHFSLI